jgi:hypothetical protein
MTDDKKSGLAAALALALAAAPALAQEKPKPATWWGGVKLGAYGDAGVTFNPDGPEDNLDFAHLFTDKANQPLLNQLGLVFERPIDGASENLDIGFKLHAFYGSDARYTHHVGQFDRYTDDRYQLDLVEANVAAHIPGVLGGLDLKLGEYATPIGYEVIDPRGNFFYSHSYIFNFGIPLTHTGALATLHASPMLDLVGGIDSGVNTTIGHSGDNNGAVSFIGGFGLNLADGKYAVLALTHIGPELPRTAASPLRPDHDLRYLSDILFTAKWTDALTTVTELNYIRDDGLETEGYGLAQYVLYALSGQVGLGLRADFWRDDDSSFVAKFPGNRDFALIQRGLAPEDPRSGTTGGATTYGALTLGINYKPPVPAAFEGVAIRPELRWDHAFDSTPFDAGTARSQVTIGIDLVVPFSIF